MSSETDNKQSRAISVVIVHDIGCPLTWPRRPSSLLTIIQGLRPLRHLGAGRAVSERVARHKEAVQAQVVGGEDAHAEHRVLVQGSLEVSGLQLLGVAPSLRPSGVQRSANACVRKI